MERTIVTGSLLATVCLISHTGYADQNYSDQASFNAAVAALGLTASTDNFGAYSQGNVGNGQTLGAFTYSYDTTTTAIGIVSDGMGGQALADPTYGVFVGDESVTLSTAGGAQLRAFGATFTYAPSIGNLAGGSYDVALAGGSTNSGAPTEPGSTQ